MPKTDQTPTAKRRGRKPAQDVIPDSILLERNISTLGFFGVNPDAPSGAQAERVVTHRRTVNGAVVEAKATYSAPSEYGLPSTTDQDTYLAILSHVTEVWHETGAVPQVIALTPSELLRRMGRKLAGANYDQIERSLTRLVSTTIISEHAIWLEGVKEFKKDVFRIFDRLAIAGTKLEDGTVTARHTIWLSSWQLENLRQNYYLLLDYPTYRGLRYDIAKVMFPMLKVWLYASRRTGRFEKRYDDLCNLLGIKTRSALSLIEQQLGPSLDEFVAVGYISRWEIVPAVSALGNQYKVVFFHTAGKIADAELADAAGPSLAAAATEDLLTEERAQFVELLVSHGIVRREARRIAQDLSMEDIGRGRSLVDAWLQKPKDQMRNPPGYLVELLRAAKSQAATSFPAGARGTGPLGGPRPVAGQSNEDEINQRAIEDLRRIREYETEVDRLMSILSAEELGDFHNRALEQIFQHPAAREWSAEIRARQAQTTVRQLVAEANGLLSPLQS